MTIPHMHVAPALVASSDMVATVIESVVAHSGFAERLAVFDFPLPKPGTIRAVLASSQ